MFLFVPLDFGVWVGCSLLLDFLYCSLCVVVSTKQFFLTVVCERLFLVSDTTPHTCFTLQMAEFDDEETRLALAMSVGAVDDAALESALAASEADSKSDTKSGSRDEKSAATASGTAQASLSAASKPTHVNSPAAATAAASAGSGGSSDTKSSGSNPVVASGSDLDYRNALIRVLIEIGLKSADAESFVNSVSPRFALAAANTSAASPAAGGARVSVQIPLPTVNQVVQGMFRSGGGAAAGHACRYADVVTHLMQTNRKGSKDAGVLLRHECMCETAPWFCTSPACTEMGGFENRADTISCEICLTARSDRPALNRESELCGIAHGMLMTQRTKVVDALNAALDKAYKTEQQRLTALTATERSDEKYLRWEVLRGGGAKVFTEPTESSRKQPTEASTAYRSILIESGHESVKTDKGGSEVWIKHPRGWSTVSLRFGGGYQLMRPYLLTPELRHQNLLAQVLEAIAFNLNERTEALRVFVTADKLPPANNKPIAGSASSRDSKTAPTTGGEMGGAGTGTGTSVRDLLVPLQDMLREYDVSESEIAIVSAPIPKPTPAQLLEYNNKLYEYEGFVIIDRWLECLRRKGVPVGDLSQLKEQVTVCTGTLKSSDVF